MLVFVNVNISRNPHYQKIRITGFGLVEIEYFGMWYSGITHASGACNPGSIPGIPTKRRRRRY